MLSDGKLLSDTVVVTLTRKNAQSFIPGLLFDCFEGEWCSMPDFGTMQSIKSGRVGHVDLSLSESDINYAIRFYGFKLVVDNDGCHAMEEQSGVIQLSKGMHQIEILFFQAGGGQGLNVLFESTRVERGPIPEVMLFSEI